MAKFSTIPDPIVDSREENDFKELTKRYEKLCEPSMVGKAGKKIGEFVPQPVLDKVDDAKRVVSEQELYVAALESVANGFTQMQKLAARYTLGEADVIRKLDKAISDYDVDVVEKACFARSYDLAKLVNAVRTQNMCLAFVEGAATGAPGFIGIPFNLAFSTFLYFRAVQSIAMFYGYDVRNDAAELEIAGQVFSEAMAPNHGSSIGAGSMVGKIMLIAELQGVKQAAAKTWGEMAARGGVGLLLAQMRALANEAARKALETSGAKGLEKTVFKSVFEQIGKRLPMKTVGRAIPFVSGAIGALFDTSQMSRVLEFADLFYQKRFIAEKRIRINELMTSVPIELDVEIVRERLSNSDCGRSFFPVEDVDCIHRECIGTDEEDAAESEFLENIEERIKAKTETDQ